MRAVLPSAQASGRGRLTVWGFEIYDATLWVAPGFRHGDIAGQYFALELSYLRNFAAADTARRSIEEMRRAGNFDDRQAQRWQSALEAALRDVRRGDRITGIHHPGRGVSFMFNGQPSGRIDDPQFARLFFAIWLAPSTSEPALRQALLEGTSP